jgi:hypothetical protein
MERALAGGERSPSALPGFPSVVRSEAGLGRRWGALFVGPRHWPWNRPDCAFRRGYGPRLGAPVRRWLRLPPNGSGDAQRLHHQTVELVKPRTCAVRLVVLLIPDPGDRQPARLFQAAKLPVNAARSTPHQPDHLRALEATFRMAEEERQDPPLHRGEKGLGEHAPRVWISSHIGNNHTLSRNQYLGKRRDPDPPSTASTRSPTSPKGRRRGGGSLA